MKNLLFLFIILFFGCNSNDSVDVQKKNSDFVMFGLMIERYNSSMFTTEKEMYAKINEFDLSEFNAAEKYDSLTHDYKLYLEEVYEIFFEEIDFESQTEYSGDLSKESITNRLFFDNDEPSDFGREFLRMQNEYRNSIVKYIQKANLIRRINQTLQTDDSMDRNGVKINYLDLHIKDKPPIAVLFYIKYLQHSIIGFENEHFKNLALTK